MRVTAKEASTKRCPEGFGAGPVSPHGAFVSVSAFGGSIATVTSPMNCIAGGCMAWRWTDQRSNDGESIGYCGKSGAA